MSLAVWSTRLSNPTCEGSSRLRASSNFLLFTTTCRDTTRCCFSTTTWSSRREWPTSSKRCAHSQRQRPRRPAHTRPRIAPNWSCQRMALPCARARHCVAVRSTLCTPLAAKARREGHRGFAREDGLRRRDACAPSEAALAFIASREIRLRQVLFAVVGKSYLPYLLTLFGAPARGGPPASCSSLLSEARAQNTLLQLRRRARRIRLGGEASARARPWRRGAMLASQLILHAQKGPIG